MILVFYSYLFVETQFNVNEDLNSLCWVLFLEDFLCSLNFGVLGFQSTT